jgi:tRNA G10  N-methylase Trm11
VPNKSLELNSAQVLHNNLTKRGAWELILLVHDKQFYLAQTLFVQDIEAYAARDQARPMRDARVGMLPPKLAQIMVNLANPPNDSTILDPFCGTGVILQESLLMGYNVIGADMEPRMVEFTEVNLEWLKDEFGFNSKFALEPADATNYKWPLPFDAVVSEVYLGRPLSSLPAPDKLNEIINDVNTIVKKFLKNLASQTKLGNKICLAVPAWQISPEKFKHLPVIDDLTDMGYNYLDFKHVRRQDLLYYRKDQIVARELIRLERV